MSTSSLIIVLCIMTLLSFTTAAMANTDPGNISSLPWEESNSRNRLLNLRGSPLLLEIPIQTIQLPRR